MVKNFTIKNRELIDIRPLKNKAASVGGILQSILGSEPDFMDLQEYLDKCSVWVKVLHEQQKGRS